MTERVIHASLDLLDRQIVDSDEELVGKVDDVELTESENGLRLAELLVGPQAYGPRLGGHVGRWIASIAVRLGGKQEPVRIPIEVVDDIGVSIKLKLPLREIERVEGVDHWLRDHFIGRIPGAGRATE